MGAEAPDDITGLLRAWSGGDQAAGEKLAPLIEQRLRRIARRQLARENADILIDTTSLIDETYVRLIDQKQAGWRDRVHFFAAAARIIRHILVDHARAQRAVKRGGDLRLVPFEEDMAVSPHEKWDLQDVDDALESLAKIDPRKGRVVELRFFAGLSVEETAEALAVSPQTVLRDWRLAKAWLVRELSREVRDGPGSVATD